VARPDALRSGHTVVIALAAFVALGLPDGMLGVAWPSMRGTFGQPLAALGLVLLGLTCGYLAASAASGFVEVRLGTAAVLMAGLAASAVGTLAFATAPSWPLLVLAAFFLGLGAGSVDAGANAYVALEHGVAPLNLLHAGYGLGAALGPAVMTVLLAAGLVWRLAYAGMVAVELALLVAVGSTWRSWSVTRRRPALSSKPGVAVPLALVAASLAMFFVYTGVEMGAGQWSYTFLTAARAVPGPAAGLAVSGYWAGLTIGRLAGYATGERLGPLRLLHVSVAVSVAAVAIYWSARSPLAAMAALAATGVGLGPIFPSLVALTPIRVGEAAASRIVGLQVAVASAGGSLGPAAVGVVLQGKGPGLLPLCLAAGAAILLALHVVTSVAVRERR